MYPCRRHCRASTVSSSLASLPASRRHQRRCPSAFELDHSRAPDVHAPRRLDGPVEALAPFVSAWVLALASPWTTHSVCCGAATRFHWSAFDAVAIASLPHAAQAAVGGNHGVALLATGAVCGFGLRCIQPTAAVPTADSRTHQPALVTDSFAASPFRRCLLATVHLFGLTSGRSLLRALKPVDSRRARLRTVRRTLDESRRCALSRSAPSAEL